MKRLLLTIAAMAAVAGPMAMAGDASAQDRGHGRGDRHGDRDHGRDGRWDGGRNDGRRRRRSLGWRTPRRSRR
jgi:Ni/Co efflux regulator RcnB